MKHPHRAGTQDTPRIAIWAFLLLSFLQVACSEDDPAAPPEAENPGILVPGDAESIEEALTLAEPGDVIVLAADTLEISVPIEIEEIDAITLRGRVREDAPRAVLRLATAGRRGITVDTSSVGIIIEGIEMIGNFSTGVQFDSPDGILRDCRIDGARSYSISTTFPAANIRIEENLLIRPGVFGINCIRGSEPVIVANTIAFSGDCGIYTFNASPRCERNLVAHSVNYGIACFGVGGPVLECSNVFDSGTSNYSFLCDPAESDFFEDPLFCDEVSFMLQPDSPCLTKACGRVGAVDACESP